MKTCKKLCLFTSLFFLIASFAFANDFGMELTNSAGVNNIADNSPSFYTDHKGTLWLSFPFDNTKTNSLSIESSAYAAKPASSDAYTYFVDLDLFRLSLVPFSSGKSKISLDAGRIPVSDVTGFVLNQSMDGTEFHGAFPFGNIDLLAGYTGLLNVRKGGAIITEDDTADVSDNADNVYAIGSKRIVGKLTIQIPQLIGSMDVILEGVGQYDLRRFLDTDYIAVADTVYGTLSLSGPVLNNLYYSISGTYQDGILDTSNEKNSLTSAIASMRFDLFPAAGNQMFAQFVYSPALISIFSEFTPISFQSAGTLYTLGYDNLLRASAGWYLNPLPALNLDIGGKVFMHPKTTDTLTFYDCTEISLGATVKATSDLRFRIDSTVILPNEGDLQYQASIKAILDI